MSNLRIKAAAFFLANFTEDSKTIEEQLQILEDESLKGNDDKLMFEVDDVQTPMKYENEALGEVLQCIDDLEKEFQKVWNEALMLGYKNGSGKDNIKI